jgi:hypothetical protein
MSSSNLIRLGGLVVIVGSLAFALVLLLRPWLAQVVAPFGIIGFAEAVTLPMYFLLFVVVSVAIVAIVALLRGTRHSSFGVLASGVSLVGVVLVFVGLLMGFAGIVIIPIGILVTVGGLGLLAILTTRTNTLPRWGGVALVAGGFSFILVLYLYHPLEDSLIGVPWLVVGYAIFRAVGRRTERPPRVR